MDELPGSFGTEQQHGAGGASTIEVDNITKLINALNRATAGVTIRLKRGEYKVDAPLSSQRRFNRRPAVVTVVRAMLGSVHSDPRALASAPAKARPGRIGVDVCSSPSLQP
jgi:hypothetical protein